MFAFLSCAAKSRKLLLILGVSALALSLTPAAHAGKKKKSAPEAPKVPTLPEVDTSNLVWPDPPDIARVRWIEQYRGEPKPVEPANQPKKKATKQDWMLRLAGVAPAETSKADRQVQTRPSLWRRNRLQRPNLYRRHLCRGRIHLQSRRQERRVHPQRQRRALQGTDRRGHRRYRSLVRDRLRISPGVRVRRFP